MPNCKPIISSNDTRYPNDPRDIATENNSELSCEIA